LNWNVGQIDINREPRHISDKEVDGRSAFNRKFLSFAYYRENLEKQRDLP
jgi:hypothetical protein